MRNVLFRRLDVEVVPSVRGQSFRAAYCYNSPIFGTVSRSTYVCSTPVGGDILGQTTRCFRVTNSSRVIVGYERVCVPERPYIPDTPAYTIISQGWDAGAVSVVQGEGTGWVVEFRADPELTPVLGGFAAARSLVTSYAYNDCTHAFRVGGDTIAVVERGRTRHTISHDGAPGVAVTARIVARGSEVNYYVDGELVYTSNAPAPAATSFRGMIYQAATMFAPVFAPFVEARADIRGDSDFDVELGPRVTIRSDPSFSVGLRADMRSRARFRVVGVSIYRPASSAFRSTPSFTAALSIVGSLIARMPAMRGLFADVDNYGAMSRAMPALRGGGLEAAELGSTASLIATMPRLQAYGMLTVGVLGTLAAEMPAPRGIGSEEGLLYGTLERRFPPIVGFGRKEAGSETKPLNTEVLLVPDSHSIGDAIVALLSEDALGVSFTLDLLTSISKETLEAVGVDDQLSLSQLISLLSEDVLHIDDDSRAQDWLAAEYVTAMHGAIGQLSDINYRGFVRAGGETYAWAEDGIYRVGEPGEELQLSVDFGADDFGAPATKQVNEVYFGVVGTGELFAKVALDNGVQRTYRVVGDGDNRRALLGRGLRARHWRVHLEAVGVEELELLNIEYLVAVSGRRLQSRR